MTKINLIYPKTYDFNGIKPKITVDIDNQAVKATIIRSTFTSEGAHFVVDVDPEVDAEVFMKRMAQNGAKAYKRALVSVDKDACIECGHCTALCNFKALVLDDSFHLVVDQDNCTGCRSCVDACVRRCITVQ